MFKRDVGAQILLYGAYAGAVAVILQVLFLIFRRAVVAGIISLIIGGFMVWVMYTVANEYMAKKEFEQWKAWVVLVLSALGMLNALMNLSLVNFVVLIVDAIILFGAAALLFGSGDTEVG